MSEIKSIFIFIPETLLYTSNTILFMYITFYKSIYNLSFFAFLSLILQINYQIMTIIKDIIAFFKNDKFIFNLFNFFKNKVYIYIASYGISIDIIYLVIYFLDCEYTRNILNKYNFFIILYLFGINTAIFLCDLLFNLHKKREKKFKDFIFLFLICSLGFLILLIIRKYKLNKKIYESNCLINMKLNELLIGYIVYLILLFNSYQIVIFLLNLNLYINIKPEQKPIKIRRKNSEEENIKEGSK